MKEAEIRKLRKAMEKKLDERRYEHTLGVSYTAAALAMCHGVSQEKAMVAGLLHDCAKCLSDEKRLSLCEKNHLSVSRIEKENPFLLHAKVGSLLARKKYGIQDREILSAIESHTTGRPGMGPLEKIVFVADYIEPGRRQAPDLDLIRQEAFQDLDLALVHILRNTLAHLRESGGAIDEATQQTYAYYLQAREEDRDAL